MPHQFPPSLRPTDALLKKIGLTCVLSAFLIGCVSLVRELLSSQNHQGVASVNGDVRVDPRRVRNAFARWHRLTTTVWSTRAGKRPDAVECDGRAQGASLLSTHRLAYCPYGLACFSARPVRRTSCWTSAAPRASQHDRSKEAGCGEHNARAGLNLFVFNRSARGK